MDSTLTFAHNNEGWVLEWNQESKPGDAVAWTDDHAKTWTRSTLASPAFFYEMGNRWSGSGAPVFPYT